MILITDDIDGCKGHILGIIRALGFKEVIFGYWYIDLIIEIVAYKL